MNSKRILQNTAILLLILIGIKNLFIALPLKATERFAHLYSSLISHQAVAIHQTISFLLGLLMIILAYRVYKRIQFAWAIEMISLAITIVLQIQRQHTFTIPLLLLEIFVFIVLGASYRDFSRKSDRLTVRMALGFIAVSAGFLILNATVGMLLLHQDLDNIHTIYDAMVNSVKLLVFLDTGVLTITGKYGKIYADSLIAINWTCIIASLILLLKPLVYDPIESKYDRMKVRDLVLRFGQNPMSYLSLEQDKHYFFGERVNGICAYQTVGNVFVVCGDMICDEEDGFAFLTEILAFCRQNGTDILFLNVTDSFLALYRAAGFGVIKFGEDACFRLSDYQLSGGKVAKVRAAINHATKAGITVAEYHPNRQRDPDTEHQISDISNEWLAGKGGEELGFMLGGTNLEQPLDRRYFYAADIEGRILGYVVFLPYLAGKGYLADVTRRRNDAPQGVLEKIIYEAFMKMKEEGVVWGNMGLSPLYHVADDVKAGFTEKLFGYIYENMNQSYDFKALHHAKEKYAPTDWQPRYLAFSPRPFSPALAYALVRVQVGTGLAKLVFSEITKGKIVQTEAERRTW